MKKFIIILSALACCMGMSAKKNVPEVTCPWDRMVTLSGDAHTWCAGKKGPMIRFVWDYQNAIEVNWTSDKQTGIWNTEVRGNFIGETPADVADHSFSQMIKIYAPALKFNKFLPQLAVKPETPVDYEVRCRIDTIDTGNAAAVMFLAGGIASSSEKQKRGGAIVSGEVTVVNAATGEEVCRLQMIRTRGIAEGIGTLEQRLGGLYINIVLANYCCQRDPLTFKPLKK